MVNQPSQTTTSDTIKIRTSVNNQQLLLNTTTHTAHNLINYPDQQDQCYNRLDTNNHPNMIYSDMSEGKVFRGFLPLESEFQPDSQTTIRVIGEELNTPVIDYTRPDFNLYTNARSNESLKQPSTGLMLNNNNSQTINNNNNSTVNQSSIINAADVWCSDNFTDYQSPLFSPDSTKSTNSPSGLNSSDLTEESFIFETTACDTNQPVKYSQDYEDFGFVDEIDQISKLKEFNTDDYPRTFDNNDGNDTDYKYEPANNFVARAVLYQDTMITGLAQPATTMLLDDDSYLVTVNSFDDLMIKPESKIVVDANVSNINVDNVNSQVVCVQNISDYILTPAPSPKSPTSITQNCSADTDDCENSSDCFPVNEMNKASSPAAEDRLHLDHNYNINNPNNNRIDETSSCKRKLVMDRSPTRQQEKRTRRGKSLKLNIPIMRVLRQDSNKIDVNTPDITNDILEMEDEKFDLISYIISPSQDKPIIDLTDLKPATTTIPTQPASPLDLESIINEQCPTPTKRRRVNSYDNPGSVQSVTSTIVSDDSSRPAPKRRGRPPKTTSTIPSPSLYKDLSESDWKYLEMRNKNNEASRRSRINRKDRESKIEAEARELETEYNTLAKEEKTLLKQVAKWRQAVMKLALV
ncbi:hypothetical protein HA402_007831 [Bradysia odoriphaga]|nr:hypothetical protein HA402_007831 [Bradysia odoriphaga]